MIKKYITPEESLILVITTANQDDETAKALELAREFDSSEKRTIRIMTKYDKFDSPERARFVSEQFALSESKHQPHAIACRINGESYCADQEMKALRENGLESNYCGIANLKHRLVPIQCELLQRNLPKLQDRINIEINKCNEIIETIGENPPDRTGILTRIKAYLIQASREWEEDISIPLVTFRDQIQGTQKIINEKFVNDRYRFNAFKCVFF